MEFIEQPMRPPQEADSLLLRATQGCTYNKCRFCYVSRGYPFMAVTAEQLEEDIMAQKEYFLGDTPIYMTGSNPFALPASKLKEYIAVLRKHFPDFERLSMQSRIGDIGDKSAEELRELRELGLNHLYIGTENGNNEVLAMMNKGHDAGEIVEQLLRLDEAGIGYTAFYILGMGGKGLGLASGEATAHMFNRVHPTRITTTGMTVFPNTPLAEMAARGEFVEASECEKILELRIFLNNLTVDAIYDGIHYLNPVHFRFSNSDADEKYRVLASIDNILDSESEADLEKRVNRKEMKSL